MINAIVQNKHGETAVIDLTVHYHEIYKKLQSLGYYGSPERLLLRDEEDEEYSVKLYSDSDIGNSMILLLNERDCLYDAYLLDLAVTNAREEIKTDLEQNLLHGQYTTFSEVLDDINQMKIAAAETRLTFFCPLEATIYDDEGYYSPASNYTISDNRDKIENMLGIEQVPDLGDMAEYVGEHSGIGNKLIYAVWGLEEIRGEVLSLRRAAFLPSFSNARFGSFSTNRFRHHSRFFRFFHSRALCLILPPLPAGAHHRTWLSLPP